MLHSKMNEGLVSVIVPVYNVRPYLEEAIESLIHQTYPLLEIILVDDGSSDGSEKVCDRYAAIDGRIRVIHQKNCGLSAARNAGLDHCTGEAVAFLDPDDYYSRNMIAKMFCVMNRTRADIVECGYVKFKGNFLNLKCDSKRLTGIWNKKRKKGVYDGKDALLMHLDGLIANSAWNKLYKREVWNNLRFREGQNYEDLDIILPLLEKAGKICIIENVLVFHRERPGSITTTFSTQNLKDRFAAHCHYIGFIRSHIPQYFNNTHVKKAEKKFLSTLLGKYNSCAFRGIHNKAEYLELLKKEICCVQRNINLKECNRSIRISFWLFANVPIVISGMVYLVILRPFQILMKKVANR